MLTLWEDLVVRYVSTFYSVTSPACPVISLNAIFIFQIEAAWEAVYNVFFNNPISEKMQLISSDRERLKTLSARSTETQKRLSSATEKSLRRRRSNSLMSKSQTSNGCKPRRSCLKMAASYPSPMSRQKL